MIRFLKIKSKKRRSARKRGALTILLAVLEAVLVLTALIPAAAAEAQEQESGSKPVVIMLDAGHGGSDPGAVRTVNGVEYTERAFNDALMAACYERLTQYDNVIVYRTRVANNHISTYARATYAHNVGADLFLSFHINSTDYKPDKTRGASTIIPCGNYRKELMTRTALLTDKILKRLETVGLKNNGYLIRKLEDAAYLNYPDGSAGDYYEVIRMGVNYNIPSLILETAFITNDGDLAMLNDKAKVSEIGAQVADAIAEMFGLKITGNTLPQPVQTAQTSGVSLGSVPKTLNLGDIYPLTASGGSGEGEYVFTASNKHIARVEGNNLIIIGGGAFRVTVTRSEGETTTPRSAGNTNVTAQGVTCGITGELAKLEYDAGTGTYRASLSVKLDKQIEVAPPQGTVKAAVTGGETVTGGFTEAGECVLELTFAGPGTYGCTLSYTSGQYDGYTVPNAASLTLEVDPDKAATPTPAPTEEPTPTPELTETPEATETPEPTAAATTVPAKTENGEDQREAEVSFGMLEILMCLLVVAVIITVVLVIKLASKKKSR
ncbi:MAG: N-acetylmuramoyl-L-alanine amidase [Clostridia bacterium]|nr:N-acetylmuramoyl-L-alanine amidase [Clostridia bacterium]